MKSFALRALLIAAAVWATALAAQKPPRTEFGPPGWTTTATAILHVSGLKCPAAAWKGYDTEAPEYHRTDDWYGVKVDAYCQYSVSGMDIDKTFTVNLVHAPNIGAAAAAEVKNAEILAQRRSVTMTPAFSKPVRRRGTYRVVSYGYEAHHRTMIITRDRDGEKVFISAYIPIAMPEEKVWAVAEPLFAANP